MKALDVVRRLAGGTAEERLVKRARSLPAGELVMWVDATVPNIGRAFGDFVQQGHEEGLKESLMGAAALLVVLEELERRRSVGLI